MDTNQAKDMVIRAGVELVKRGLIARTWGNVSQRLDEKTMVITPSGKGYLSLKRQDIVPVDISTLEYTGEVKPSSEKAVHASCYRLKGAQFVIHTHQVNASVVSACGIAGFDCDKKRYPLLGGRVVLADYGLPGTKKLNAGVEKALNKTQGHAIIMKHHGALCFGESYEEAFEAATQLEEASQAYIEEKYKQVSGDQSAEYEAMGKFVLSQNADLKDTPKARGAESEVKNPNDIINTNASVMALSYMKKPLYPMLDDFAQIVGVDMKADNDSAKKRARLLKHANAVFIKGVGALCTGPTSDDAQAVSMIVEKNCKAYIGARLHGKVKPINRFESRLMRMVYKMKYSKQMTS